MFEENISNQIEKEILYITRNTYVSVCVCDTNGFLQHRTWWITPCLFYMISPHCLPDNQLFEADLVGMWQWLNCTL